MHAQEYTHARTVGRSWMDGGGRPDERDHILEIKIGNQKLLRRRKSFFWSRQFLRPLQAGGQLKQLTSISVNPLVSFRHGAITRVRSVKGSLLSSSFNF